MQIGLFGFPKVGKTTLFNTLTGMSVPTNAYAVGKRETHVGIAGVPDARLDRLSALFNPEKTTYAKVEYLDVVGVEKGAASGSDTFLADVKNADALLHVVRAFENPNLPHSQGRIDPKSDVSTMETELILSDHTVCTRRIERLEAGLKKGAKDGDKSELELLRRCLAVLEKETPLREVEFSEEEARKIRGFMFFSAKPLLVVLNLGEDDAARLGTAVADCGLEDFARRTSVAVVPVSAVIEMEIARLGAEDRAQFMKDLGIGEPCLDRLIRTSYDLLGLLSFFTVGEDECRAWTIQRGSTALEAAGAIHSDIQRGFIRGEVTAYEDLVAAGSLSQAKAAGKMSLEGKEYVVRDGDIVHFRHNT